MLRYWFWLCLTMSILFLNYSDAAQTCAQIENSILFEVNQIRENRGLKQLKNWGKLCDCAREHSQNMAEELFLSVMMALTIG